MFSGLFAMYDLVAKHIVNITRRMFTQVKLRSGQSAPQIPLRSMDYSSPPTSCLQLGLSISMLSLFS